MYGTHRGVQVGLLCPMYGTHRGVKVGFLCPMYWTHRGVQVGLERKIKLRQTFDGSLDQDGALSKCDLPVNINTLVTSSNSPVVCHQLQQSDTQTGSTEKVYVRFNCSLCTIVEVLVPWMGVVGWMSR